MAVGVQALLRKLLSESVYWTVKFTKRLFLMPDGTCRHTPTCTQYTREAIQVLPLYKAVPKIIRRVISCRPGGGFGYDPVIKDSNKEQSS